jgi:hypothetical protein
MLVWIHHESPAFSGESYYRLWTKKPVYQKDGCWYDKHGNTSHSFRIQTELMSALLLASNLDHLSEGLNKLQIKISREK